MTPPEKPRRDREGMMATDTHKHSSSVLLDTNTAKRPEPGTVAQTMTSRLRGASLANSHWLEGMTHQTAAPFQNCLGALDFPSQ